MEKLTALSSEKSEVPERTPSEERARLKAMIEKLTAVPSADKEP